MMDLILIKKNQFVLLSKIMIGKHIQLIAQILFTLKLYHMYYAGHGGEPLRGRILYAYSKDKKNWKKAKYLY